MYRPFLALAIGLACASTVSAQAFVENVSPPAMRRGATTRVTVVGAEIAQIVGLWTSLPEGVVKATVVNQGDGKVGQFDVHVADSAPLGLYGLRVATTAGLSNVHLFVIDDLPLVSAESLPIENGRRTVTLPAAVWGAFREAQVDRFAVQIAAGERVAIETVGGRLGKDADPLVSIYDSRGRLLVQSDNDVGLFFDSRFEHTFVESGTYTVELSDSRYQGSPYWNYLLRLGKFPAARVTLPMAVRAGEKTTLKFPELPGEAFSFEVPTHLPRGGLFAAYRRPSDNASCWFHSLVHDGVDTVEAEPNDLADQATKATVPGLLHGCIGRPGDRDAFVFELAKGQKVEFRAETRTIGSAADVELTVFGVKGNEIRRVDDVLLDEASLSLVAPEAGQYRLEIRDMSGGGGPAFVYRVEARAGGPHIELASAFADFTAPQGSYQSLPVTVTRTEYPGPIELTLIGAPAGVTLEPSVIPEGANDVICALRVPATVSTGLYSFRIEGHAKLEGGELSATAKTQPMIDRQLANVDLIKYGLRENQRYLPPSLTENIALMVTPPAPFTFELPDTVVTLARYQSSAFPLETKQFAELDGPITFASRGGPVGRKSQLRIQVYTELPPATREQPNVKGQIFARNLAQVAKSRIEIDATAVQKGRKVTLTRSFQLDLKTAFEVLPDPAPVTVLPGELAKLKLAVNRLPAFKGEVTITPTPVAGLDFPESVTIPANQGSTELEVKIPADFRPGRLNIRMQATGQVEKFQEELNFNLAIEVKKPEVKK
jgi:hypothetical protein